MEYLILIPIVAVTAVLWVLVNNRLHRGLRAAAWAADSAIRPECAFGMVGKGKQKNETRPAAKQRFAAGLSFFS